MEPTLATGDKVLINKVSYKLGEPERGDIVAFKKDAKQHSSMHVKRIIGLPGETVQIKDGLILINGETYMEKKDFPKISNPGLAETQITLGKNEYFVLGDNRNNSEDSRFAEVENVKQKYIVGKIWLRVSPFGKFGLIKSLQTERNNYELSMVSRAHDESKAHDAGEYKADRSDH